MVAPKDYDDYISWVGLRDGILRTLLLNEGQIAWHRDGQGGVLVKGSWDGPQGTFPVTIALQHLADADVFESALARPVKGAMWDFMRKFRQDPSNPGLRFKQLKGDSRLCSARVTDDSRALMLQGSGLSFGNWQVQGIGKPFRGRRRPYGAAGVGKGILIRQPGDGPAVGSASDPGKSWSDHEFFVRRRAYPHLRAECPQPHRECHHRFDVPARPVRRRQLTLERCRGTIRRGTAPA